MKKAALLCMAVLLLAPLAAVAGEGEMAALKDGQARVEIPVSGMTCGGCCTKVETAVMALDGVVDVKANYEKGIATITFEKDKVAVDKIVTTINEKTSFKAKAPKEKKA